MPNRLADETSPYLLQHKDNPVDWYPWGPEALETARQLDKPILLSVGYAACHWCHVMEHESFEDPATAEVMNRHFVCIKVDREERPDIDAVYMEAVQAMTGHGGWPMTVFLTPAGVPFYGGTYFPPTDRHGLPAFTRLLEAIAETWTTRRDEVEAQGAKLIDHIGAIARTGATKDQLDNSLLEGAASALEQSFDREYGGFSGAPKFPQPMNLDLALRLGARGVADTDEMVAHTLDRMAAGGMYDQLGGGFARYSVDRQWLVPHFEKMLYDNAQLLRTYARAYRHLGVDRFADVAHETVTWMLTEMRDPAGGFWSSLDADSEGVEGRFYVWDLDEVAQVTGDDFELARRAFGFTEEGNFEGHNIPVWTGEVDDREAVERVRATLVEARSSRTRPGTDDKVLAAWNGLTVSALCEAGLLLGEEGWISAADEAMRFVLDHMVLDGRLMRSYRRGTVKHLGYAEDHALVLEGCLALFEATGEVEWLGRAREIADKTLDLFLDREKGGFFTTGDDAETLITRAKDLMDNAVPSANSVMALELQRLGLITGEDRYREEAERVLKLIGGLIERVPLAFGHALGALDMMTGTPMEIVLLSPPGDSDRSLLEVIHERYLPNKVLVRAQPDSRFSPLLEARDVLGDSPTAYVCFARACRRPVTDPADLRIELETTG